MLKLAFLMNWAASQSFSNGVTLSLLFKLLGCMCGRNHLLHIEHWHCASWFSRLSSALMSKSSKKSVSFSRRLLGCKWVYKPKPTQVLSAPCSTLNSKTTTLKPWYSKQVHQTLFVHYIEKFTISNVICFVNPQNWRWV